MRAFAVLAVLACAGLLLTATADEVNCSGCAATSASCLMDAYCLSALLCVEASAPCDETCMAACTAAAGSDPSATSIALFEASLACTTDCTTTTATTIPATTPTATTPVTGTTTGAVYFDQCQDAFAAAVDGFSAASEERCKALQIFSDCLVSQLHEASITDIRDSVFQEAVDRAAVALNDTDISCQSLTLPEMINHMEVEGDTIVVHGFTDDGDFRTYTYSRSEFQFSDLLANLNAVIAQHAAFAANAQAPISAAITGIMTTKATQRTKVTGSLYNYMDAATLSLSTLRSSANKLKHQAAYNLPYSVINAYDTMASKINQEADALEITRLGFLEPLTQKLQTVVNAAANDAIDRNRIIAEDSDYITSLTAQVSAAVSAFTSAEDIREPGEAQAIMDQAATAAAYASTVLSTALASEVSRSIVSQSSMAATIGFKITSTTGSTDFAACLTSEEGSIYQSQAQTMALFYCDGAFWNRILTSVNAFAASRIIDVPTSMILLGATSPIAGYNGWTICYSGTVHGWSGSLFHSYCNNKGSTFVIAKDSTRIYGAYVDEWWANRQNYVYSYGTVLWRLNGNVIETVKPMNHQQYALYDYSSYCPTFGGGHDWYNDTSCKGGYTSQYSYYGPGYSSSWLSAGTVNHDQFEVWMRNG